MFQFQTSRGWVSVHYWWSQKYGKLCASYTLPAPCNRVYQCFGTDTQDIEKNIRSTHNL